MKRHRKKLLCFDDADAHKIRPLEKPTLYIDCDTITLNQKAIDLNISLQKEIINKFDSIIINGIKFNKE